MKGKTTERLKTFRAGFSDIQKQQLNEIIHAISDDNSKLASEAYMHGVVEGIAMTQEFGIGDKAYIIERNRIICECTIVQKSGDSYIIRFEKGTALTILCSGESERIQRSNYFFNVGSSVKNTC